MQGAGPPSSSTAVELPQRFEPWVQAQLRPSPALSGERLQRVVPAGQGADIAGSGPGLLGITVPF